MSMSKSKSKKTEGRDAREPRRPGDEALSAKCKKSAGVTRPGGGLRYYSGQGWVGVRSLRGCASTLKAALATPGSSSPLVLPPPLPHLHPEHTRDSIFMQDTARLRLLRHLFQLAPTTVPASLSPCGAGGNSSPALNDDEAPGAGPAYKSLPGCSLEAVATLRHVVSLIIPRMSFLLPSKKRPPKTGHGSGSGRGSQSKSGRGSKSSSKQNDPDEGQEDEPYDLERETDVAAPRTWAAAEQQHDFEGQVTGQDPATVNYTYGYTQSQPQSSPVRSHTSGIPASLPYGRGAIQFAGGGPIGGPTYRTEPNEALSELTRGMRNLQYSSNTDPYDVTVYRTPFPSAANVPSTSAQLSRAEDALPEEEEDYYGADDGEQSSGRISGATQSQPLYAVTPHRVLQTEESYGLSDENSQDPFQITRASNMLNFDRSDQQMQLSRVDSGSRKSTDITAPTKEALHPDYKVHHASSFQFKKVFKILWPEPTGDHSNNGGTEKIRIKHGEVCYASIRRFVIVYAKEGHCLCLPILTYGGQATRKKGLKAQDHAIVYMDEYRKQKKGFGRGGKGGKAAPPELERGEEKLDKVSIRIVPLTPRDKLDPRSRLNYAKIYTVEYNVKVCFIGKIHESSVKYFKRDYNLTHSPLPLAEGTQYSDEDEDEGEGENEGYE